MSVSKNVEMISDNFDVTNHRFMNMIANGVSQLIAQNIPGLQLRHSGKSINGNIMSSVLLGEMIVSEDELKSVDDKVRNIIQGLKNPANLISVMQE